VTRARKMKEIEMRCEVWRWMWRRLTSARPSK
jgi:hypothetical protein